MTSLIDSGYQPISTPSSFDAGGLFSPSAAPDMTGFSTPALDIPSFSSGGFRMADPVGTATTISRSSPSLPGGPLDGLSGLEKLSAYMELGNQAGNAVGNVVRAFRGQDPVAYRGKGIQGIVADKRKAALMEQLFGGGEEDDANPSTIATPETVDETEAGSTDIDKPSDIVEQDKDDLLDEAKKFKETKFGSSMRTVPADGSRFPVAVGDVMRDIKPYEYQGPATN